MSKPTPQTGTESPHRLFKFLYLPSFLSEQGVIEIPSANLHSEIFQSVTRIEDDLKEGLKQIEERLAAGQGLFEFFDQGLKAYREHVLKDVQVSNKQKLLHQFSERIRLDKELGFSHRKILDFLLGEYDLVTGQFNEVCFSKLVKESHVAKGKAKTYLSLLERKDYIKKREDGYRILFKISGQTSS